MIFFDDIDWLKENYKKIPLSREFQYIWRHLPESNRTPQLCRPLYNRSTKAPFLFQSPDIIDKNTFLQSNSKKIKNLPHFTAISPKENPFLLTTKSLENIWVFTRTRTRQIKPNRQQIHIFTAYFSGLQKLLLRCFLVVSSFKNRD